MKYKFYTLFVNYCDEGSELAIFTSLKSLFILLIEIEKIKKVKEQEGIKYADVQGKVEKGLFFTYLFENKDWICIQGTDNEEKKIVDNYLEVTGIKKEEIK